MLESRRARRPAPLLGRALAGLGLGLALALPAAQVAAAEPGDDLVWGVRTGTTAQGEGRENYAYTMLPGTTLEDSIVITNHDDAPLELDVYAADAFTTPTGQLDVLKAGETSRDVGTWVALREPHVSIPAGGAVEVPFTVEVPANATPGDHAGGIVTSLPQPEAGSGITVDRRLGVRMQIRVDGELAPALAVEDLHVGFEPTANPFGRSGATVTYTVHNTGNVRLSASQTVALHGPGGLDRVELTPDAVPELLPGESWPVSVHADVALPLLRLQADVTLDPAPPAGLTGDPDPFTVTTSTLAVPWAQLALLLLVASATVVVVRLRRRALRRRREAEDARVRAAVEAALAANPEPPSP